VGRDDGCQTANSDAVAVGSGLNETSLGALPFATLPPTFPLPAMIAFARDTDVQSPPALGGSLAGKGRVAGERFALLDALRGLGALAITCYHVHRYRPLEIPADRLLPKVAQFLVGHGWVAVQVFWVIAGFVLAYSLRKTAIGPASFGNFTLRRVLRLGMPYWTAILLVVAIDYFASSWFAIARATPLVDDPVTWPRLAANLTFLQDILHLHNISAGTWFVCVDLQCGLLFAVMLWFAQFLSRFLAEEAEDGRTLALPLCLVFVPLGLVSLFWLNIDSDDFSAWVIYFFHLPLLGALAWWAIEGRVPRIVFWSYLAAMAGGVVHRCNIGLDYKKSLELIVAATAATVIYLGGRRGHLGDWLTWRPLQFLGRISYSLFLIHYPVSWMVVSAGCSLTPDSPKAAVLWMALAVVASVGAAQLFYVCVEAPSLRLVKRLKWL
jgi:peptidoglycan/LPS O-acetylase OafA/YrhL